MFPSTNVPWLSSLLCRWRRADPCMASHLLALPVCRFCSLPCSLLPDRPQPTSSSCGGGLATAVPSPASPCPPGLELLPSCRWSRGASCLRLPGLVSKLWMADAATLVQEMRGGSQGARGGLEELCPSKQGEPGTFWGAQGITLPSLDGVGWGLMMVRALPHNVFFLFRIPIKWHHFK